MAFSKSIIVCFLFLFGQFSWGQLHLAPPNFPAGVGEAQAVYVDFLKADYTITYDVNKKSAEVTSKILFESKTVGMPLFDLVPNLSEILVDGDPVSHQTVQTPTRPGDAFSTTMRLIGKSLPAGEHTMIVKHKLEGSALPTWGVKTVNSGFFMNDFNDRGLLETFLPTNLEFDQMEISFKVEVLGTQEPHTVFSNGVQRQVSDGKWMIQFPQFFNCSTIYFHLVPTAQFNQLPFEFLSNDGRKLNGVVYAKANDGTNLSSIRGKIFKYIESLESRFGAFPHDSITVYMSNVGGGMEYSGATITDEWALSHELAHSYFARGILSANGNAGWIDEALATYTGGPYIADPSQVRPSSMGNHSPYYRKNDSSGYQGGLNLIGFFDQILKQANSTFSMNLFLKNLVQERMHTPITTSHLESDLKKYSGIGFENYFDIYVYGKGSGVEVESNFTPLRPLHINLTDEVRRKLQ